MGILDFLTRNVEASHRSNAVWGVHEVKIGPFSRWIVFCWHEAIGAKYWVLRDRNEAMRVGELHVETGEKVAKQRQEDSQGG